MTPDVAYAILAALLAAYAMRLAAARGADTRAKAAAEDKRQFEERMALLAKGVTDG